MTSGQFTSFPIDKIYVNREVRQRRELTDIKELAESIAKTGLIHPPVIRRDGELKTGERRWTACKSLGWTAIPVQFVDDLSESDLHLLELEENVRRVDLPWQDQCKAVEIYHELRAKDDANWSVTKTAKALGLSYTETLDRKNVAKQILSGNERVISAPRYTIARGIVARDTERKKASVLEKIDVVEETLKAENKTVPLIHIDFAEWQSSYSGNKFNFIHCDFPYGINANKHDQGAAASFGGYADNEAVYWNLLSALASAMDNVVAESAHLMFWFSMEFYEATVEVLTTMGWAVNKFPLIWHKSDNLGILPDPQRGPRRIYETALIASRGDRKIVRAVSNVVSSATTKTIHMSEKPKPVLNKFFEMFVDEHTTMLDPTAGSANAVRVAQIKGANTVLGLERDLEFFTKASEAFYNDEL